MPTYNHNISWINNIIIQSLARFMAYIDLKNRKSTCLYTCTFNIIKLYIYKFLENGSHTEPSFSALTDNNLIKYLSV